MSIDPVAPDETVLVIGAGFIGSHVCRRLLDSGRTVRALTRSEPGPLHSRLLDGAEVVLGDAADPAVVGPALEGVGWVIFGAGGLIPAASQRNAVDDVVLALRPLLTVLEAISRRPGTGLTYLSSGGTVYGRSADEALREDHPTDPITSYGVLKLAGEKYVGLYGEQKSLPVRVLRCANVYGTGQDTRRGQGAVGAFLERIVTGVEVTVFGDGLVARDFVHVSDVAEAVVRLRPDVSVPPYHPVVNVGSGEATDLNTLISEIERVVQRRARVLKLPARNFDVPRNVLNIHLLRTLTGIEPIGLAEGLRRTASWAALD